MTGLMTRALGERLLAGLLALTMTGCTAEPAGDPDAPPAVLPSEVRDIVLTPDTTLVAGLVPHRTTLDTLLRGHGVADDAAMSVVSAARQGS